MRLSQRLVMSVVLMVGLAASRPGAADSDASPFWHAMKTLSFDAPAVRAAQGEEREYALALRSLIGGDREAENVLGRLTQATDPRVRRESQRVYVGLLAAESRWAEIEAAHREADPDLPADVITEFAKLPPETLTFPDGPVTLPAKRARFVGTPVIPVEVNGHHCSFWVDTGAGLTVLSSDIAKAMGVSPLGAATTRAGTATKRTVEAHPAVIDDLSIGGIHFRHHPVMILRKQDLRAKLFGVFTLIKIDGILGWNALSRLDLEVDLPARSVVLRPPAHNASTPRNLLWLGEPLVQGHAPDGTRLLFSLDTGGRRSFGMPGLLQKPGIHVTGKRSQRVGGAGGTERVIVRKMDTVQATVSECSVPLTEIHDDWHPERMVLLDGFLGVDIAGSGWLRIDPTNGRFECRPPQDTP
jgi:hypothetical protein